MGLLELQRVTWSGSSGALLQKIMLYALSPKLVSALHCAMIK